MAVALASTESVCDTGMYSAWLSSALACSQVMPTPRLSAALVRHGGVDFHAFQRGFDGAIAPHPSGAIVGAQAVWRSDAEAVAPVDAQIRGVEKVRRQRRGAAKIF